MRLILIHLRNKAMTKVAQKTEEVVSEKHPQRLIGIVVSAGKMTKTIAVKVDRLVWHLKLHKQYSRSKKYLVHDDKGEAKMNDKVMIEKCRPMSARKNFRLVNILTVASANKGEKE